MYRLDFVVDRRLQVKRFVPIIWTLQDTARYVVKDDPASCFAAINGVGARRAQPAGAP